MVPLEAYRTAALALAETSEIEHFGMLRRPRLRQDGLRFVEADLVGDR